MPRNSYIRKRKIRTQIHFEGFDVATLNSRQIFPVTGREFVENETLIRIVGSIGIQTDIAGTESSWSAFIWHDRGGDSTIAVLDASDKGVSQDDANNILWVGAGRCGPADITGVVHIEIDVKAMRILSQSDAIRINVAESGSDLNVMYGLSMKSKMP